MSDILKPLYTTFDSVKTRLQQKIQFQQKDLPAQEGEMSDQLLAQIISDAETEVEADLRGRYAIPFRSKTRGDYASLPDHSKRSIRMAVDLKSVYLILMWDYGRGTHIDGEEYSGPTETNYKSFIKKLLGMDQEGAGAHDRFRFSPPLEDLLLAHSNREADDGYKGRIINTDGSCGGAENYAKEQINNPSRTYLNRRGFGGNEVL